MQELRTFDERIIDLYIRYNSLAHRESKPFVPTPENFEDLMDETKAVYKKVKKRLSAVSDDMKKVALSEFAASLEVLEVNLTNDRAFADRFISSMVGKTNTLLNLDARPDGMRADVLGDLLAGWPEVIEAAEKLARSVPEVNRKMFLDKVGELRQFLMSISPNLASAFPHLSDSRINRLAEQMEELAAAGGRAAENLKKRPLLPPEDMYRPLPYEQILKQLYGIDIEELLSWHKDEVRWRNERLHQMAAELDPDRDPFQILEEDIGPWDDPDELLPNVKEYVKRTREESLKHITLPEGENCDVWPVPSYLKDSYPWGGYYSGGNALRGNLLGAVFLNVYNYQDVTRGWAEMNAIHECYPGHHAHFVKTAAGDMPDTFKMGRMPSRAAPLSEAVAHRSETLLQDLFDEPAFPLFVAYRRLHTAVRIWADLLLYHFNEGEEGVEKAVDLYQEYLQFSRTVARGQVYAQQLNPGYFTVYYYGLKKLREIEKECEWDEAEFTELIFSSGKIGLDTLRGLIDLSAEQREKLTGGFRFG